VTSPSPSYCHAHTHTRPPHRDSELRLQRVETARGIGAPGRGGPHTGNTPRPHCTTAIDPASELRAARAKKPIMLTATRRVVVASGRMRAVRAISTVSEFTSLDVDKWSAAAPHQVRNLGESLQPCGARFGHAPIRVEKFDNCGQRRRSCAASSPLCVERDMGMPCVLKR